ncbi:XdhC family protein [Actinomycetospora callitridis]|uniref:XdhC family protein n=1 Tax=Actinomycetospora callitridis TaxID=913944 RepID=UPI002365305E|nr:XdhC family protein [Actinomycetospora callitridis]MDD7919294.1 XdhC family protein [Actinomycetospora callitridis]
MSELTEVADVLARGDEARAVVRVLDRHGFGTVEPGQLLVASADGTLGGVLLRGALDDRAAALARDARRAPSVIEAHVAEDDAVAAGLACAGGATLLGHPLDAAPARALAQAFAAGVPAALVTRADGSASLAITGGDLDDVEGSLGFATVDAEAASRVRQLLRRGATVTERVTLEAGADVLVDLWVPVPTMVIVGPGAIADALIAQAGLLGWVAGRADTVAEADAAVAAFTDADVLVLLDHDPAFDAVLRTGLEGRGFLGALGSRRTQAARRERLLAAGVTEDRLARIHGPVGLDLGARTPAETAVSIVGEVLAVRSGRDPSALGVAAGPIGA